MSTKEPLHPTLWRSCRVLANCKRLRIFRLLADESNLAVSAIAERLKLTLPAASQHLRALEARGFLAVHRLGGRVYYRVPPEDSAGAVHPLLAPLTQGLRCDPAFGERAFRLATAFTQPRRIEIYRVIAQNRWTSEQIRQSVRISRFALARHLAKLQSRGFIEYRKGIWTTKKPMDAFGRALAQLARRSPRCRRTSGLHEVRS